MSVLDMISPKRISLILDSGAFSAWTKQIAINLDDYIQFCLSNLFCLDYIVNLDVIPGRFGQKNIPPDERERSAFSGWRNYRYMLSKGIPVDKLIHVFHQGEDFKWLIRMVKEISYIGLSPANDRTTSEKMQWLDECMNYVTDKQGLPLVKFHGFAVTSLRLMLRYPWYSVDSTSWVMHSRMGSVLVPRYRNGKWIYNEDSWKVSVSTRSPNRKDVGKHIDSFEFVQKKLILKYFQEKGYVLGRSEFFISEKGYKLKKNERWNGKVYLDGRREVEVVIESGLSNDYRKRDDLNIIYFLDLEKTMPSWPWSFKAKNKYRSFGI